MTKNLQLLLMLLTVLVVGLDQTSLAQTPTAGQRPADNVNTNTKMIYHDGSIMAGDLDVYLIWYGCWDDNCGRKHHHPIDPARLYVQHWRITIFPDQRRLPQSSGANAYGRRILWRSSLRSIFAWV